MNKDFFHKYALNKYTHSVRASQAVLQYGVGAMVDFPDQTLMTAAPEFWETQIIRIHDERLEHLLKVDYFGVPGGLDKIEYQDGISYVRFPEWYFCPKCRKFQPISAWIRDYKNTARGSNNEKDPNMVRHMQCPTCREGLVVARIIVACEKGHIDDFPWVEWVHCKNKGGAKPICSCPSLTFKTSASSTEGLEGLTISCNTCKAEATLRGAFEPDALEQLSKHNKYNINCKCSGRHPWKNTVETCSKYPRALQRGSSSVYFPVTESSLVIPPYSDMITRDIENSAAFAKWDGDTIPIVKSMMKDTDELEKSIKVCADKIYSETGIPSEKIVPVLERKWIKTDDSKDEFSSSSIRYRAAEYEALRGEISGSSDKYGDFVCEQTDIGDYRIPYVSKVTLIHKVREVQALIGFSRIQPVEYDMGVESNQMVSIKEPGTNWYPAYEVRGEGIFIEFDEDAINKWKNGNEGLSHRIETLNDNYQKSYLSKSRPRHITAKFLLLHTISHALIKQLSFDCGYNIASLKERIYCAEESDGKQMAGILIYTASGDSEGTLGGLVRQGCSDLLPSLFQKAMESLMVCSNDPVCGLSKGQGRDSLNLSACYSCSLIPETSCEEYNVFLDRGTIVGTYDDRQMGFYYKQLYCGESWIWNIPENVSKEIKDDNVKKSGWKVNINLGSNLKDTSFEDIWKDLGQWSSDDDENGMLSDLAANHERFASKEKPYQDCSITISGTDGCFLCDLFWKTSNVAFFMVEHAESYKAVKDSDIKCFCCIDGDLSIESLLNSLKDGN